MTALTEREPRLSSARNIDRLIYSIEYLHTHRQNDVYLKSRIVKKRLMQAPTLSVHQEKRINTTRIDLAFIGKTMEGVEIKSDFDNEGRLSEQIANYEKVFPFNSVLTGAKKNLEPRLKLELGVYRLGPRGGIQKRRMPTRHESSLDSELILQYANQPELQYIWEAVHHRVVLDADSESMRRNIAKLQIEPLALSELLRAAIRGSRTNEFEWRLREAIDPRLWYWKTGKVSNSNQYRRIIDWLEAS